MKKFFQSKGFIVSSLALLCVTILGVCWFVSRDRTGDFRPDESPPSSVTGDWSDGGTQTDGDNGADAYAPGQSTDAEEEYPKVTSQTEDEVVIDFTDTEKFEETPPPVPEGKTAVSYTHLDVYKRQVQARVIAVAEKVVRVEVFGVETSILARDLAWDWIGDAHERFSVGDEVLVRILSVRRNSLEDLGIKADIKSISENTDRDNLQKCRIQGKYAGRVTDVHKGVVYVRLSNGVNAVAHSCYDYRMPGKKDDVSFAVTRLDMERGVAVGIITRIIRQNL